MVYEWAFIANALIFGGLTVFLATDPFSSDDDTDNTTPGLNLTGTNDDDRMDGTDGDDILLGLGGADVISGFAGDDRLEGNTGNDTIFGGTGDDSLAGGGGTDVIYGGPGNDVIGSDRLDAEVNWARGGAEQLFGDAGDDQLLFSPDDIVSGGSGADSFRMVYDVRGEAAQLTDFDPAEDSLTLYAEFDETSPPAVTISADDETRITSVAVDGRVVLTLNGVFTAEQLAVTLRQRGLIFTDAGLPA
ncbi:calcium-binding protein [Paracoccus sp. NSM]|uniref:calcium-binding protein n=1 Tax=Paracoccus sp. NSM TaxID=3457784 RepID=UPI00403716D7